MVRVAFLKTMPFRISVAFQTKAQDLALGSQFWACFSTLSFRQHFHWLLGTSVRFHWCAYPKFSPVSLFPAFSFLGYSLVIFLCAPWNKRPSLTSFVLSCVYQAIHSPLRAAIGPPKSLMCFLLVNHLESDPISLLFIFNLWVSLRFNLLIFTIWGLMFSGFWFSAPFLTCSPLFSSPLVMVMGADPGLSAHARQAWWWGWTPGLSAHARQVLYHDPLSSLTSDSLR